MSPTSLSPNIHLISDIKFGIVPIRKDDHCMIYRTHYNHDGDYNICVGGRGIIARDGDSGGPLTCILKDENGNNRQVLYGASSFSAQKVSTRWRRRAII